MNRLRAIIVARGVAGGLAVTGCHPALGSEPLPAVPSPEVSVTADLRGIQLQGVAGDERIMFSHVSGLRWTPSTLVVTGTVDAPGSPDHRQVRTLSFPLDEVNALLVREYDSSRSVLLALGLGGLLGILAVLTALR